MIKNWICKFWGHKNYNPSYNPRTGMTTHVWHNRCLRCGKAISKDNV